MNREPIGIVRIVRRMRGGSQAHLVEGNDGRFYVAKFMGNPQGTRTLINEWFAHQLLQKLGVSTPPIYILRLTEATLNSGEYPVFLQGTKQIAVEPGLHFGSQCPVNPESTAIFDFLPGHVLSRLVNPEDFARVLVLDFFLANTDSRQVIFVRDKSGKAGLRLRAYMIDNGSILGGSLWQFPDYQPRCTYFHKAVYSLIDQHDEYEQTHLAITSIAQMALHQLVDNVPRVWFSKLDEADWAKLMDRLETRKSQLPRLWVNYLENLNLRQSVESKGPHLRRNACMNSHSPEPGQQVYDMALFPTLG